MKKIILTLATALTIVACKKQEVVSENEIQNTTESFDKASNISADSAYTSIGTFPTLSKKQTDSALSSIKNIAIVRIEELKDEKELLTEKVAKEIDSATRKTIVSEIKATQLKIDSVKSAIVATKIKVKSTPKIIKETKIIYREKPEPKIVERKPIITKKGSLEIMVDDIAIAQMETKEQIEKYDGTIKNQQISSYDGNEYNYLQISVPLQKSEYLINDLQQYVGNITSRNIEITGQEFGENSICLLEITLFNNTEKAAIAANPQNFGGRTLGAVGSGWNVIQEIFLFILPFWPIFLIGGGIYYFVKKKNSEKA